MYTDDELQNMRFDFSRALERINREFHASTPHARLQDLSYDLNDELSKMHEVVWKIPNDSVWNESFTVGYNAMDEAAQWMAYALGATDDERPERIETTKNRILQAVQALAMS